MIPMISPRRYVLQNVFGVSSWRPLRNLKDFFFLGRQIRLRPVALQDLEANIVDEMDQVDQVDQEPKITEGAGIKWIPCFMDAWYPPFFNFFIIYNCKSK